MRFNPDTERGITLATIDHSAPANANLYPEPEQIWDCRHGHWKPNPNHPSTTRALSRDEQLEGEATLALWSARYKLQQVHAGSIPAATIESLRLDIRDIARELQRLSA